MAAAATPTCAPGLPPRGGDLGSPRRGQQAEAQVEVATANSGIRRPKISLIPQHISLPLRYAHDESNFYGPARAHADFTEPAPKRTNYQPF